MPPNDRYLTLDDLKKKIELGDIDTVVLAFTDMQGRLQGKRLHGQYFLDVVVEHGTEGCNYLLAVDIDMNTVDGYAISSWERGYGDMEFVPDWETIRLLPHLPATAMVQCDLVWLDHAPVLQSPRGILKAQLDALSERELVALAGTELEFIAFNTSYEEAYRMATAASSRSTSTTSTTRSSAPPAPSRCCATSGTRCTPRGSTSRAPRASATSGSTRSASCTPMRWSPPTTTASTRPWPRRSRPSAARRSRSWPSTTSARAAPATSTSRCEGRTATSCSGTALHRSWRALADVRQLRGRRARHDARLHPALRPEHQLLQAVRGRLVRPDRDRLGRGQPHLRRTPGRARAERPDGEPRARRRRQPLPRTRRDAGRRPARHRAGARARAGAEGQRLPLRQAARAAHAARGARRVDVLEDRPRGVRRRGRRPLHEHGRRRAEGVRRGGDRLGAAPAPSRGCDAWSRQARPRGRLDR